MCLQDLAAVDVISEPQKLIGVIDLIQSKAVVAGAVLNGGLVAAAVCAESSLIVLMRADRSADGTNAITPNVITVGATDETADITFHIAAEAVLYIGAASKSAGIADEIRPALMGAVQTANIAGAQHPVVVSVGAADETADITFRIAAEAVRRIGAAGQAADITDAIRKAVVTGQGADLAGAQIPVMLRIGTASEATDTANTVRPDPVSAEFSASGALEVLAVAFMIADGRKGEEYTFCQVTAGIVIGSILFLVSNKDDKAAFIGESSLHPLKGEFRVAVKGDAPGFVIYASIHS